MKKRIVIIGAAILLLTATGAVTLKIINSNGGGTSSAVDIEDESLLNKYISLPNKKVNEFLSDDSSTSYKNILFATQTKFAKESKYIVTSSLGNVEASVAGIPYNQEVSTRRIINENDTFFQTNTISTFVKKSEQRYTNLNSYLVREGSNPSIDYADYSSSKVEALSKKDYMNRYGHTNRDIFNYAINDSSFLNGVYEGQKEDGLFYFTYTLDPVLASAAYVREVAYMAGASSYPIFSDIHFTIAINDVYEIQKSTINEVYTTPILGGLNCSGVFNETYTYYSSTVDCSEKEYFSPYFGTETGEIEKEKTAMDYLSALGDDPSILNNLAFRGNIKVNDEDLDFKIKLDLSSSSYYVSINDALDIIYLDSKAYIITNNSSYLVTKDELDKVIYLVSNKEDIFSSDTLMALLENPFVSKIVSSMSVSKEENYVDINIPFNDESKIVLHLYDDESSVSILGLDANLIYESYTLNADFSLVSGDSLTFKDIPTSVKEITNISPLVTKVKDIVDQKGFYGEINFEKELSINETKLPLKINGLYYVSLKDEDNPLYKFDLTLSINDSDIPLLIDGNKEKFYLKIGDSLVTNISYEELINIINRFVSIDNKLPEIEIEQLFNTLVNVIDNLDFYEDYIEFNLDSLNINLFNGTIKLSHNENLLLSYNDSLNISLLPYEDELSEVTYEESLNLSTLVDELLSYINNGYYNVTINNLTFNDVNLNGEIDVHPNLTNIEESSIKGNLEISYQNIKANVNFYYVDKKIYLTLNENSKVYLTLDEIKELLNEYVPDLNLSDIDLSNFDVLSLINSINAGDNEIKLDLNEITASKFNYELVISLSSHNIKLVSLDSLNDDIILKQGNSFNVSINENEYVNLKPVISSLINVYSLVSKQDISTSFSLDCLYNSSTYSVTGEVNYKKTSNGFIFSLEVTSPIEIKVSYIDETFYIDIESSHIKFNKASLKHVLSEIKEIYEIDEETISLIENILDNGLDIISSLNIDTSSINLNINNLFNAISLNDEDIVLNLNLNQFVNEITSLKVVCSTEKTSLEEISLNDISLNKVSLKNIKLNNLSTSKDISVSNEESYLDLSTLVKLNSVNEIKDFISNKVYSLELNETFFNGGSIKGNISYLDLTKLDLSLLGSNVIKIEDIINDISLSGEFILKIDSLNETLRLKVNVNNGLIQVKFLDNNYDLVIGGTYSEIVDILDDVKTTLGTTLSNYIKDLDLSKLGLPLEIESNLSKISLDTIITYLKDYSINDIVKYFDVSSEGKIDLRLNLSSLTNKLNEVNIIYDNSSLSVNISSLTSLTLSSASKIDDFESEYGEVTTCSFIDINNLITSLNTLLETRKFDGNIKLDNLAFNLNVKDIASLFGFNLSSEDTIRLISNVSIYYQIDFDETFDFYLDIAFDVKNVPSDPSKGGNISLNTKHLIVTKVNKDIYFKLSNIVSHLTYEEWLEVIKYFEDSLSLDFNINYAKVNEIIDELSRGLDSFISYIISSKENNSSSNISSYIDINKIISSLNYASLNDNESEIGFTLSLEEIASKYNINFIDLSSIEVNLNTSKGQISLNSDFELNLFYKNNYSSSINEIEASNYVTCSSLKSVIDQIVSLKNTFKQKKFVISTSSSASSNYVSKDNKKLFDYSGKIVLSLEDEIKFNINNVTLNAYEYDSNNNVTTSTHNFSLAYLPTYTKDGNDINKDSLFINYGPNLKGYLSRSEFASLAQYGCDLMGINSTLIKSLLSNLGSADSLDTSVLSGITSGSKIPDFNINLDNLFDSYTISQNDVGSEFEISLNAKDIYASLYGEDFNKDNENLDKNIVSLKVCSSKDQSLISKLKLENMYSSSCEVFNIDLDISNSFTEEEISLLNSIDVTNTNNELGKYYYLGNIPTLLKAFVNTANLRKYHVTGSLSMNLGKWNLQNIGYDVKIVLDDNNKPYIEVTFNANYLFLVMDGGQSKLLYSPTEEKVYLRNNKSKENRVYTFVETDSSYIGKKENIAEIINIILGSWSTIKGTIEDSVSNTSPNIDINTILKNYSYSYDEDNKTGTTNVTLDGTQLMSSLSNLNVHLTNLETDIKIDEFTSKHGDYLTSFNFDTKMSVITLSGNGKFNNIDEITSNIAVDLELLSNAINHSSSWSF